MYGRSYGRLTRLVDALYGGLILVEVWITTVLERMDVGPRDLRNCCVLASFLVKSFQWHSIFPSDMCAVMIQECLVGYACETG